MGTYRVTTPAAGYNGLVGNVMFHDGTAVIDDAVNPSELAYCTVQGYVVEAIDASEDDVVEDVDGDGTPEKLPKRSASADEWRSFAVAHGMGPDEAAAKTRDELVAHYYEGSAQ